VSQKSVEKFLGRIATDEEFRARFRADRGGILAELMESGEPLTAVERAALLGLDLESCERFAGRLDPRIQKCCTRRVPPA